MQVPLFLVATLLLVVPASALATPTSTALPVSAACLSLSSAPPCGYITPIIDLDFPSKQKCSAQSTDLSKCMALLEDGKSVSFDGTLRWYWKESEDLNYPETDPNQPIVITFSASATNPKYLKFEVEPKTFTIDQVALADPQNRKLDQSNPSSPIVYFWFERPITLTITRHGDPSETELQGIASHNGVQSMLVKAKSSASGAYFKESFGVESFGFDARSAQAATVGTTAGTHTSPAWGLAAPTATLALLAWMRRRR